MSINCAWCKELIDDEPVRKGRHYFCGYECLEDHEKQDRGHEEDYEFRRDRDDFK